MRTCETRRAFGGALTAVLTAALLAASCGGSGGSVEKPDTPEVGGVDTGEAEIVCGEDQCGDGFCDESCGESVAGAGFCQADCCVCGNGECEFELCGEAWDEKLKTCSTDCAECGNGSCDPGEGPKLCAVDCCGSCGDGVCKGGECGEGPETCEEDCGKFACGDGSCDPGENPVDCLQDCEPYACGNGTCEPGESPEKCAEDCAANCGDCECQGDESYGNCPVDCGFCGDGYCIGKCEYIAETSNTCVADCCLPECADKECGPDSCGGWCGQCPAGWDCVNGVCLAECQDECTHEETICFGQAAAKCGQYDADECLDWGMPVGCPEGTGCQDGICICHPDCAGKDCGPDGCGGSCGECAENALCLGDGSCFCGLPCGDNCCPSGAACAPEGHCCAPQCEGKNCGPDDCGGSCGNCPSGFCVEGHCQEGVGCTPSTTGTCGGCSCESCVCAFDSFCCQEWWDHICTLLCATACGGCEPIESCGDGQCQPESMENCGTCPADCKCPDDTVCSGQECHFNYCAAGVEITGCCQGNTLVKCVTGGMFVQDCALTGAVCGWDTAGEGGADGYYCGGEGSVNPAGDPDGEYPLECPGCVANCVGKECGNDGCSGSCGVCGDGLSCFNGSCIGACLPSCWGKDCGDDGCGGSCGVCGENQVCHEEGFCYCPGDGCDSGCCPEGDVCAYGSYCCTPSCEGKSCGDDGCGQDCGDCASYCVFGQCQEGKGCVPSQQPTCAGCSCEPCVCEMDEYCCQGSWDEVCASICAQDCGGCEQIDQCGDGSCEPQHMENCGTCPYDCTCPEGTDCHGQECVPNFCQLGVDMLGCCVGQTMVRCVGGGMWMDDCEQKQQTCGWSDGSVGLLEGYSCGNEAEVDPEGDPSGEHPLECPQCIANCLGKECGGDGCGGSCGHCPSKQVCFNGSCADICLPSCEDGKCGSDGCGGECEECGENEFCNEEGNCQCEGDDCAGGCCGAGESCFPGDLCAGGKGCEPGGQPTCGGCSCQECVCLLKPSCCTTNWDEDCAVLCATECGGCDPIVGCGDGQCEATLEENCSTCPLDCKCPEDTFCHQQKCHFDYCQAGVDLYGCCFGNQLFWCFNGQGESDCGKHGEVCGWSDGSGSLPMGYHCGNETQVDPAGDPLGNFPLACPQCTGSCVGKECGDDGCGGSCGDCSGDLVCFNGSCADVCLPDCQDKNCGDDSCGGSCGECGVNQLCADDGNCICAGDWCEDECCPAGHLCFSDGNCHGVLGCVESKQPTCGGCSCEECVCAAMPHCCTAGWDPDCAQLCALLCGGCDPLPSCGDGFCEPGNSENCGTCPADCQCGPGSLCSEQECITDYCADGIGVQGCCQDNGLLRCFGGLQFIDCAEFGLVCGWWDPGAGLPQAYECGTPDEVNTDGDPTGLYPLECPPCSANCLGKECGGDGCGGSCGICDGPGEACLNGSCAVTCLPACLDKECGDDGCGGSCGACGENATCDQNGQCQCPGGGCDDKCCAQGEVCVDGGCCQLQCDGLECGGDGCGGECGICGCGEICQDGHCSFVACDGKDCGDDGCGGECDVCPPDHYCLSDFTCLCIPDCKGKECGDDGCGGSCGGCHDTWQCTVDSCGPDYACRYLHDTLPCNDGNPDTSDDMCTLPDVPCNGLQGEEVVLHAVQTFGAQARVVYSKSFDDCGNIENADGLLVNKSDFFCLAGECVEKIVPLDEMIDPIPAIPIYAGIELQMCNSNIPANCSAATVATETTTSCIGN